VKARFTVCETHYPFLLINLFNEILVQKIGAAVAAALSDDMKRKYPDLKNIGIILCGGNIDVDRLPWYSSSF